MITPEYCRVMARYNAWQNKSIWDVVQTLSPADLDLDRGAFFGSIRATLNHLLWGDTLWLCRFQGTEQPKIGVQESLEKPETPAAWWAERFRLDGQISQWANDLSALDTVGSLTWTSILTGTTSTMSVGLCITHFFNHQTHHRGQVHAMLTAAGGTPDDTDLPLMPQDD